MSQKLNCDVAGAEVATLSEINDSQFCEIRIRAFSDAITSHKYKATKKSLKQAAETLRGKPILAYYNKYVKHGQPDLEGHEDGPIKTEIPIGFVPENAEIEFEKVDDITYVVCNAYIWKVYFEHVVDIFVRDNGRKDVSVELWVINSEEKDGYTEMTEFCFTGITILGDHVNPACKGAFCEVIKFSESQDEYQKAKEEFEKKIYCSVNQEPQGSFFNTTNQEVQMENEKILNSETPEKVDNATQVVTVVEKVEIDATLYDDNYNYIGGEHEVHKREVTVVEEIPEEEILKNSETQTNACEKETCAEAVENSTELIENAEEVDNSCAQENVESVENSEMQENAEVVENACVEVNNEAVENAEDTEIVENAESVNFEVKCSELEEKCFSYEQELNTANATIQALQLKCAELEEYKTNKENELRKQAIEFAISNVSNVLSAEQVDEWREKSVDFADVDSFTNQLKAFAFDIQQKNGIKETESLRNAIPQTFSETGLDEADVWDRLKRKYNI